MRSKEILNKEVVSIKEGNSLGRIRMPVIDGIHQRIIGFIVDDREWYLETKIVLFPSVRGMQQEVVTVDDDSSIVPVRNMYKIHPYLKDNIQLIAIKIFSEAGRLLGEVEDFVFNHQTGKIESYLVLGSFMSINWKDVYSVGKGMLIVKDDLSPETADSANIDLNTVDLNSLFEQRQVSFLLGKMLSRDMRDDNGDLILPAGSIINEASIDKIKMLGKFTELLMSVEAEE
jgi:uncharacterized protein YrrD